MELRLTSLRDPKVERLGGTSGPVLLDAEETWLFEGQVGRIDPIHELLRPWAERCGREVLRVRFGNTVGVFRLPAGPTLEVVSGKWTERDFEAMLAELTHIAAGLPFTAGATGPLPYERSALATEELLYTAFVYLRHILSDAAPADVQLRPALESIVRDPHRRSHESRAVIPLARASRIDARSCREIASGSGVVRAPGSATRLAAVLGGFLPIEISERQVGFTNDTPENRFALAFIDEAVRIVDALRVLLERDDDAFARRVRAEAESMSRVLQRFRRHGVFDGVGRMTVTPRRTPSISPPMT